MVTFSEVISDVVAMKKAETDPGVGRFTALSLTEADADALESGTEEEWGVVLYAAVQAEGVRVAIPRIYGMDVTWDAEERSISWGYALDGRLLIHEGEL